MTMTSSTQFASAIASGTDWRDTSKAVLEDLEKAKTPGKKFNFGFLYVSDYLADDLTSILNLFKSVLEIDHWVGSVGLGVCGNGVEYIDEPAISAMIGYINEDDFCVFPPLKNDDDVAEKKLQGWLDHNMPMMVYTHGDPLTDTNPAHLLARLDDITGGYIVGGLTSSRTQHFQIADDICENGFGGVVFSENVAVTSTLSQGCKKAGETHTITKGSDHRISELDDCSALDVFENDIRIMTIKKTDIDPSQIRIDEGYLVDKSGAVKDTQDKTKGEVLAAFPISDSDQDSYMVRNIIAVDEDERALDVAHPVAKGERVVFVYRDDSTVRDDLCQSLKQIRARMQADNGTFAPTGGLYITCVARAFTDFSNNDNTKGMQAVTRAMGGEMKLVRDIIGDVPLTGFYAAGEINCGKQYGYSGVLILFG